MMSGTHATAAIHDPSGMLCIHAGEPDGPLFLSVRGDGRILAYNGHVDLGTGIRTSLAQIAAEELDVAFEAVEMVLGSTIAGPDQGATIASETIQVTAIPLRQAAATARAYLLQRAAELFSVNPEALVTENGAVHDPSGGNRFVAYVDLVKEQQVHLAIDSSVTLKPASRYRIVGMSRPRVDIPAKATGEWVYVHDVRVPGMLHGRVVRPPYGGYDHGETVASSLISVDESSVSHIDGLIAVVVIKDFVGVVATREENAVAAMEALKVEWRTPQTRPDLNRLETALRANPATPRRLADKGNVDLAIAASSKPMHRTYVWPYQMHGSIGPSCAVADHRAGRLTVWSGTQNPFPMRRDLALLLDMAQEDIVVERLEAAGCYGRNCADDATGDAALLSRAVGAPVRLQLTREQEHIWEPKGAAQVMDVRGGLDLEGGPAAYDFETRYPSNLAPTLGLILTGKIDPRPETVQMGDRTAIPPYAYGNLRVTVHDMPPIARASWFRGVSAMPNTFAHECYIDELAAAAGVDPIDYRLRYLHDPRAVDLVRAVAERAGWEPHTRWGAHGGEGDLLYGRGFAYAVYVHGKFPGTAAAWAAWVCDVAVNRKTGEIAVTHVICGQDSGQMINPDGVRHQIHGNIIQSTSRVLKEKVEFSETAVVSKEWGGYPLITFPEVPDIDVLLMPRPDEPPLGVGESASVPSAAAIANAVYDATGIRLRELPLTPEAVLAGLRGENDPPPRKPSVSRRWWKLGLSISGIAALSGMLGAAVPWRPAIAPIGRPDPGAYSAATIERGRLAAAIGACNVCHRGEDGTPFAGGRRFETPFGVVYASNITPEPANGIGGWSYPAFERAMRQGIGRAGHHLYPVHPYTSFARAEDVDLQALYAYLMTQMPSASATSAAKLAFPMNWRGMMAGWNVLFHREQTFAYDAAKSASWNRGAYLVETLGHCSACHTQRNTLGAEKTGAAHLSGGFAGGWEAPALNALSRGPVTWTADAFYGYMRTGHAQQHGGAAGPMAKVVDALAPLPDEDIRAMADYLASLNPDAASADTAAQTKAALTASENARSEALLASPRGQRIFETACASCHGNDSILPSLALNGNLHAATPDNLLQAVLGGVEAKPTDQSLASEQGSEIMSMPAFRDTLNDSALNDLAAYLRARFAPGKERWTDVGGALHRVLASSP